jgi:hypothetical protein
MISFSRPELLRRYLSKAPKEISDESSKEVECEGRDSSIED